ncbi:MAG: Do family serine endopeptidase [Gemmatimonadota bacterium]
MRSLPLTILLGAALLAPRAPASAEAAAGLQALQDLSDGFAAVADEVKPSVVAITTEARMESGAMRSPFHGTPWEHFFQMPMPEQGEMPRQEGEGSGVIVEHQGKSYVVTNYHVVRGADEIVVHLSNDRELAAEVVGTDSLSDVAVLQVSDGDLPALKWGRSADLRVGEWVLAIGNPFGLEHTTTAGIISALGRNRGGQEYGSYVQTDAAINPGNSGGALVNLRGELVGLNTAIVSRAGGYDGISFAIPVDLVRSVLGQLAEHGEVRRGLLGVMIADVDAVTAEALGMKDSHGVLVQSVTEGGPSAEAGVEAGDVILTIDGEPMPNTVQLRSRIGGTPPGTRIKMQILREKKERTVTVKLGQLTQETFAAAQRSGRSAGEVSEQSLGLRLQELTPELAQRLGVQGESGLVIAAVQPGSEAARRGLQRGDVILEVNHQAVGGIAQFEKAIDAVGAGQAVLFRVQRDGSQVFLALRKPE